MIPDDVIQKIRERADILEVVGELVTLKRAGASYKGLCPFHGEKTPSFVVNPQQGTYHCFGCAVHGDSLTFIKETQNLSFPEAVRALALRVGIEIPEERYVHPEVKEKRAKKLALDERLFDIQERLTQWYELNLGRSSVACSYLRHRHINEESARAFRLGWASDDVAHFVRWMTEQEIEVEDLVSLGVVIPLDPTQPDRRGDHRLKGGRLRFRNRVMCPIFDLRDRVVGYSGRVVNPEQKIAKYLNSPETPIFTKGDHLFGLKTARVAMRSSKVEELILCEGNLDVISLWQAGFPNAVAAMGTALSERQAAIIKRLTKSVTCVMDGDQAGQKAAFKSLPVLLAQGLNVRGKPLPAEQDPDSFLKTYGAQSFKEWLSDAQPLLLTRLEALLREKPKDPIGQAEIVQELIPLVHLIQDEHQRPLFLDIIAKRLGVERSYLSDRLVHLSHEQSRSVNEASYSSDHQLYIDEIDEARDEFPSHYDEYYSDPSQTQSQQFEGKRLTSKRSVKNINQDESRPWWASVKIQRGGGRTKPRVFGDQPTGQAEIQITPAPTPPPSLIASQTGSTAQTTLLGYEREAISTLFYMPELLDLFLERGAGNYFSEPLVSEFLLSLKKERDDGRFATGETFFKSNQNVFIIAALKDCIAHPPLHNEKIDPERALGDLTRRLQRGKLQLQLKQILAELKTLSSKSHNDDPSSSFTDHRVSDVDEQRTALLKTYQETQEQLKKLSPPLKSS